MSENSKNGRKVVHIHNDLISAIEEFAKQHGITFSRAVNQIIRDQLLKPKPLENQVATREDIRKILKRIEFTNQILEPALLDLLKASGNSIYEQNSDQEKKRLGKAIQGKYADVFKQLREIL